MQHYSLLFLLELAYIFKLGTHLAAHKLLLDAPDNINLLDEHTILTLARRGYLTFDGTKLHLPETIDTKEAFKN